MMKLLILSLFFVIELFASDASYNRGETLYFVKACSSCHGPSAEGSSTYPKLANKKQAYIRKKLKYFRVGKVGRVSEQMMSQFAKKLSDQNIEDLSYFLSHHKKVEYEDISDDVLGGVGS